MKLNIKDLRKLIRQELLEAMDVYPGDAQAEYEYDQAGDPGARTKIADQIHEMAGALAKIEVRLIELVGSEDSEMRWKFGKNLTGLFRQGNKVEGSLIQYVNDTLERMKKNKHALDVMVDLLDHPEDHE
tara:strand:+ start:6133 stop:6519 length:387 start_codon:yes stop_codon:yes gene_type:complete